jgi:hypothetical protein
MLAGFLFLLLPNAPALAQCGIPGQYEAADGTCQCPPGTYHDRGTVACEQEVCPPEAGRTYTMECKCPDGLVAEQAEMSTDTGFTYNLVTACVPPGSVGEEAEAGLLGDAATTILFPSSIFVSPGQRWRDGVDGLRNGSGLERVAGAASLVGLAAEAGLAVVSLGGLATLAAGRVSAWWAGRQAAAAATRAAGSLAARAGTAEVGSIVAHTRGPMLELIGRMKQAGIPITPDNVLRLINEARAAQGLAPWGRSNLEIIRRGIGMVR